MKNFVLSNFLEAGGFFRLSQDIQQMLPDLSTSSDLCLIWQGNNLKKDKGFSVFKSDFFLKKTIQMFPEDWCLVETPIFVSELHKWLVSTQKSYAPRRWSPASKEAFTESFKLVQSKIQAGRLQKAVPIVLCHSSGTLSEAEKVQGLLSLLQTPPSLIPYGCWDPQMGMMGATPEILFLQKDHNLQTMALAGTSPKTRPRQDFLADPKEQHEHQLVVEQLLSTLSSYGNFSAGSQKVLELPSLQHLLTPLQGTLKKSLSWEELIEIMHPSSALGTYPRQQWKWLQELPDQLERDTFGAPFGVSFGNVQFAVVAIRQVKWNKKELCIGAGCGLVKESQLEPEWQELQLKIQSVQRIFHWI